MTEPFSNEPIPVEQLPRLSDEAFVSVDPRYVWGRLGGLVASAAVVVAVAAVLIWGTDSLLWPVVLAGIVGALILATAVVWILESRRLAYQVREHDLSLRRGVVTHVVETIPFSRIQHVNVGRGLLERWLGLATLVISSAGPDISVPGLAVADADRIKELLAERAGVDDDDDEPVVQPEPNSDVLPRPSWPAPPAP